MYQNIYYDKKSKKYHIWDDELGHIQEQYVPYAFVKDPDGTYTTLHGDKVSKIFNWDKEDEPFLFESDIKPEIRILIDRYGSNDSPAKNHRFLYLDIEVNTKGGFSSPEKAFQPITSIAYSYNGKNVCLLVDKDNEIKSKIDSELDLYVYTNESDLLTNFISNWRKISPTIVVHWNGDSFDMPYLINRIRKQLGEDKIYQLSPIKKVDFDVRDGVYSIAGVTSYDLMLLYKNFTYSEQPSYSLENISQHELGRGKIKYEGNLDDLYRTDLNKFIQYNVEDVQLMVDLNKKLGYIELAISLSHICHIPYNWVTGSSKVLDGASLTYLRLNGNIIAPNARQSLSLKLNKSARNGDNFISINVNDPYQVPCDGTLIISKSATSKFKVDYTHFDENGFYLKTPLSQPVLMGFEIKVFIPGAFVLDPTPGFYEWLFDLDLRSEYPMNMITLNISPETIRGKVYNWNSEDFVKNVDRVYEISLNGKTSEFSLSAKDFKQWLVENEYYIAANGVFYDSKNKGFIPEILSVWFESRDKFKSEMKKYKNEGDLVKAAFFHNRQLVQKILLNSFYGVLILNTFRFANKNNAISITSTGQQLIKFCSRVANIYYNEKLETKGEDYVVYLDTDSVDGDSLIEVNNNKIPVAELFIVENNKDENFSVIDIQNKEYVFPTDLNIPFYNEETQQKQIGKVEYIERHFVKKRMFKITTENDKSVIVTQDHSIMVLRDGKLVECKPLDLTDFDAVVTINEITTIKSVEDLGEIEQYVYDIGMVDTPHTFFANDILVHNSNFFSAVPLIKKEFGENIDVDDTNFMVTETIRHAKNIENFINDSFPKYVKHYHNIQSGENTFKIKQENVARSAVWLGKKRYAQCLISEEGVMLTENNTKEKDRIFNKKNEFIGKMEVKGINIVRSDFPQSFKQLLTKIVKMILAKYEKSDIDKTIIEFKETIHTIEVDKIMFPTGVKELDKFNVSRSKFNVLSGTPIHAKASLFYNDMLTHYGIKDFDVVHNSDKVKWCYLKTNPLKLDVLALKIEEKQPQQIVDYIKKYIDYDQMFDSKLGNVLQNFYICLKWGEQLPTKNTNKLNSLFNF